MQSARSTALVYRELGSIFTRWLLRQLIVHPIAIGVIAILYYVYDPVWWKVALPAAVSLILLVMRIRDIVSFDKTDLSHRKVLTIMSSVLIGHMTLIVVSGGIFSPIVVAFPVFNCALVMLVGNPRVFAYLVAPPLLLVWTLAALHILASPETPLMPGIFVGSHGTGLTNGYVITWSIMLTFGLGMGSVVGYLMRRGFDNAIAATAAAQTEAVETARDHNRELVSLSAALAHELKNPLASIRGLAGVMARKLEDGSPAAEQMGILIGEAERMSEILGEFLNFSRPLSPLVLEDISPVELVQTATALHDAMAAERGVQLERSGDETPPIACDPRKITQILLNLIQNALDASPSGGTVSVHLQNAPDGGVQIDIADEGPGLSDAVRGRLFTPGATTKKAGSGLGLTVARTIAEQHGGSLTLKDRPQGGCLASLTLPARPPVVESPPEETA